MKDNRFYLQEIAERIARIESYASLGQAAFTQNQMIQDAIERNLSIIGEITKRLSSELKQDYSEVPWRKIAGLRDVLIHDYGRVDPIEVWQMIEQDLPELKTQISAILQLLGEP